MTVDVDRINELTAISRKRALTPEENEERDRLRREYIDAFKKDLEAQLSSLKVKNESGEIKDYREYVKEQKEKLLEKQEDEAEKTDEYEKNRE